MKEAMGITEINAEEFMPQIAISQLAYNQVEIESLLKDGKFTQENINKYITSREESDDEDIKQKAAIERQLFDKGAFATIEGYTYVTQESSESGFGAIAVKSPGGKVIIGYRGTDFPNGEELQELIKEYTKSGVSERQTEIGGKVGDAIADAQIILGEQEITQINEAIAFAEKVSKQTHVNIQEITTTGHSLGGGLAQSVAIQYDLEGYTFNGVGTVQNMLDVIKKNGKSLEDYNITHLVNNRDIVGQAGEKAGKVITVIGSKMQSGAYGIEMTKEEYEIINITMPEAISLLKKMKWDESKGKYVIECEIGLDFETHNLYDLIGDDKKIQVDSSNKSYISKFKKIASQYVQISKLGEIASRQIKDSKLSSMVEYFEKFGAPLNLMPPYDVKTQATVGGILWLLPGVANAFISSNQEQEMLTAMRQELEQIRLGAEQIQQVRAAINKRNQIKITKGFTLYAPNVSVSDFTDEEINIDVSLREVQVLRRKISKMGEKLLKGYTKELSNCTLIHEGFRRTYADYPSVTSACNLAEREIDRVNKKLKNIGEIVQAKADGVEKALKQYYADEMECIRILQSSRWD